MRTPTILTISLSLALLIFLGWTFFYPTEQPNVQMQAPIAEAPKPNLPILPKSIPNEREALAKAEELLEANKMQQYRELRNHWLGREQTPTQWFFLDVEENLRNGQRDKAILLLSSRTFLGQNEMQRLIRLAALHIVEDPQRAWNYLAEATVLDPINTDLHLFKAGLLESENAHDQALSEYILAIQKDIDNPYLREQLADFYLRIGLYPQALAILQDAISTPSLDTIWLKTLFWSRIFAPIQISYDLQSIASDPLTPFVNYLQALPKTVFWNEQAFARLPGHEKLLETRQETFWLTLLAALKNGEEDTARQILAANPFQPVSWAPQLEKSLKAILNFRQLHLTDGHSPFINDNPQQSSEQFLTTLANLSETPQSNLSAALPNEFIAPLLSQEAYAIAFLAQGWNEAALQLHHLAVLPAIFPDWIANKFAVALRDNRSPAAALAFASSQPSNSSLTLFAADLALEMGKKPEAIQTLMSIYKKENDNGLRAAEMLTQLALEDNNIALVKEVINNQPALYNTTSAKETLARIALNDGNFTEAQKIYTEIQKDSPEAKSYLASQAFAEKDWPRARQLTQELLQIYPENEALKDNLKTIIAEEQKKQGKI